jgi:lipopolysaccharide export system permease protein
MKVFTDAYWMRSIDDIYRIANLSPYTPEPTGYGVDHLKRDPEDYLVAVESVPIKTFPDMPFNKEQLLKSVTVPEAQSLSELYQKIPVHKNALSEKEAHLQTTFYYKLAMPWLCLLAILAAAPFCLRFSRTLPVFFIYALSIFGLVAFYLVIEATVVLGERQMVEPMIAIGAPFACFFTLFAWRFLRL